MTKYFCDKCGIELDPAKGVFSVPKQVFIFCADHITKTLPDRDYDLCEDCANRLLLWLTKKVDVI